MPPHGDEAQLDPAFLLADVTRLLSLLEQGLSVIHEDLSAFHSSDQWCMRQFFYLHAEFCQQEYPHYPFYPPSPPGPK